MQHTDPERERAPQLSRAQNEVLFTIFLVFVLIALVFGVSIPRMAKAESLDRFSWEAPPALVADVLMREAVEGRGADARYLKARTHVLDTAGVDRKRHGEGMNSLVAAFADHAGANRRILD